MPFASIQSAVIPLTVNGTSAGTVTVAVELTPKPGTRVVLYSTPIAGAQSIECKVVRSDDATGVVSLRPTSSGISTAAERTKNLMYGLGDSDLSSYLVADGAVLMIESQDIPVQPLYRSKV